MTSAGASLGRGRLERVLGDDQRAIKGLGVAMSAFALISFNLTVANLAFRAIEEEFDGTSRTTLSWVLTGYSIVLASAMPIAGRMADRYGRRRVFLIGLTVFGTGAVLSALAPNVWLLIAARAIQALGGACTVPASLAMVLSDFAPERHSTVVALWAAAGSFSASFAPTIAAGLLAVSNWRFCFLASVPIVAWALFGGRRVLRESKAPTAPGRLDLVGVPVGTVAIALVAYAVGSGSSSGWTSPSIVGAIVGACVLLPLFAVRSLRHPQPLFDLRLFRVRAFAVANLSVALVYVTFLSSWLLFVLFLRQVWELSDLQTGLAITPSPMVVMVVAPLAGRLADRTGHRELISAGQAVVAFGFAFLGLALGAERSYVLVFLPAILLVGMGIGMCSSNLNSAALGGVEPSQYGIANGVHNTIRNLSGALGIAIAVAVVGSPERPDAVAAFGRAWFILAGFAAASSVVTLTLYPRRIVLPTAANDGPSGSVVDVD